MIPAHLLPLQVEWAEPGDTTDSKNNTVDDWTVPDAGWPTIAAYIEQQVQNVAELRDGRDTLVSTWLFITNELGVTARARIIWDGRTFELDGEPWKPITPAGPHHLEARLRLVEG